ncbi:30S ribosomal protein S18 [Nitzschia inconspicua]|uniref:30S ribosomal protein S18 n=1 Tax=Nitzschia inconspicua TaxID=303405 RepID=A0A9K3PLL2_9STRA|nr:30S ribosomal protein S18 [Nitzschia inconspicua]
MASSSLHSTLVSVTRRQLIRSKVVSTFGGQGLHSPRHVGSVALPLDGRTSSPMNRHSIYLSFPQSSSTARFFSKKSNDETEMSSKGSSSSYNKNNDDTDDPFGVHFEDGSDLGKLGPTSPPRYKRDAVTGKFTGEQETELTEREKKLLNMDPIEEQEYLLDRVMKEWNIESTGDDGMDEPEKLSKLAKRIREDNMGLNTLGRSVESQAFRGKLDDGEDAYVDESGFSKPLSPAEFKVFQKHMKDEYSTNIDEDDIPVEPTNQRGGEPSILGGFADTEELNTKWMSSSAMRFMDDTKDDDPFSDLLPSDLSPARLVNRRNAKPIPRKLLHHNNLALLRRYITPAGQIMNRVQSRLGAKDQRKIAKLIKRARHLGLVPTSGQFVVEALGNIHEKDIHEDREWEQELKRRGLVIKKSEEK